MADEVSGRITVSTSVPGYALGPWQKEDRHVRLDKLAARKSDHVFTAYIADRVVL